MKVFLGGTVNGSTWRDYVMQRLQIDFFNPVVENWDEAAYKREIIERENCDYTLYVITPRLEGFYALAEVVDDSFKKADKTIFCYLKKDDEFEFDALQLAHLDRMKDLVMQNGAIYCADLDEVITLLNSSTRRTLIQSKDNALNTVFISYGRRHSLAFAKLLYQKLTQQGYTAWFDMNDIPLGVDFQEQIDDGITKAHNFIYLISPHSVKSVYCRKEIELAARLGKRIIPILHVAPDDCEQLIHDEIKKRNWLPMLQDEQKALSISRKAQKQKTDILSLDADEWGFTEDLDARFRDLANLIEEHREYTENHTALLLKALDWNAKARPSELLLVGSDRQIAEQWLYTKSFFTRDHKPAQAPCTPTLLQAEYIVESRKNAQLLATDVFVVYDRDDFSSQISIVDQLTLNGVSSWVHYKDIQKGADYEESIHQGVEGADNVIFMLSEKSLQSDYCNKELKTAAEYHKRIIPVLISPTDSQLIDSHEVLKKLQYIDFTNLRKRDEIATLTHADIAKEVAGRKEKSDFDVRIDELLAAIRTDESYYYQHKTYLVQALKWQRQNQNSSILLRGYNLENANTWLKLAQNKAHKPLELHRHFIAESNAKVGQLGTEVFISYSRTDSDFARQLNYQLQLNGKTTWFDQESIASGADFQKEIYKGIEQSDNFLFILSDDAIKSPYCADEVAFAQSLNKRFVTLLCRSTNTSALPAALAQVQWINFVNRDFHAAFPEVLRTLDTDREHVAAHTKWALLATEWQQKAQHKDLLLRGSEYHLANTWLQQAQNKTPKPTPLQTQFIHESHQALLQTEEREKRINRRLKLFLTGAVAAAILAVFFGAFGLWQMREANKALNQVYSKQKEIEIRNKELDSTLIIVENEKRKSDTLFELANSKKREALKAIELLKQSQKVTDKIVSNFSFSENYLPIRNSSGKFGFIDKKGELVIDYLYDDVSDFHEGYAAVKKDGKYCFIDKKNKPICNFIYDDAKQFSNGLAAVKKNKYWGYINNEGVEVIKIQYSKAENFNHGYAKVATSYFKYHTEYNYPNYNIERQYTTEHYMYGVLDLLGQELLACQFDSILTNNLTSNIIDCQKFGKIYQITKNGVFLYPNMKFANIEIIRLKNGSKVIRLGTFPYQKYAFLNEDYKIISFWFDALGEFHDNLALVKVKDKYGFVDPKGQVKIDIIYINATSFQDGYAMVQPIIVYGDNYEGINNAYYIDKFGKFQKYADLREIISMGYFNY